MAEERGTICVSSERTIFSYMGANRAPIVEAIPIAEFNGHVQKIYVCTITRREQIVKF